MVFVLIKFFHPAGKPYDDMWFHDSHWSPDSPDRPEPTGYTDQANKLAKMLHERFNSKDNSKVNVINVIQDATDTQVFEVRFVDLLCAIQVSDKPEDSLFFDLDQRSPQDEEIRKKLNDLLAKSEKLGSMKDRMKDLGGSFDLIFLKEIGERDKVPESESERELLVEAIRQLLEP